MCYYLGDPIAEGELGLLRELAFGFQHAHKINAPTPPWPLGPVGRLARCGMRARCVKEKAKTTGPWLKDVLLSRFSHRGSKHLSKAREGSILSGSWLEGTKVHHGWDSVWLQAGHTAGTPCPLMSCQGRKLGQTINLRVCSQRDTFSKRVYNDQASATSCSDVQNCVFPIIPF